MSEQADESARVNNHRVKVQSYPLNRLLCWHRQRRLRVLLAANGADVYCEKCRRKRFGYMTIPTADPCVHDWSERGAGPDDRWQECHHCGVTRDVPINPPEVTHDAP